MDICIYGKMEECGFGYIMIRSPNECTMRKRRNVQDAISVDYGLRFTYSANRSLGV